jgi:nucleoside-diphosphate-sugar epimerase
MNKIIVVAGATGNLGLRITNALLQRGAEVRVIVRTTSDTDKIKNLEASGAKIVVIHQWNIEEICEACRGASCVVSVLSGLQEVILDAQKTLLDAAVAAGVPRFIPSDYSLDFTKFSPGENRNLDWRREFHQYLDKAPIQATTIFNGAFADLLTNEMPLILFKQKLVLYWGNANHRMGFTTINDTAIFTANAALDNLAPRFLTIAGDQISPKEIQRVMSEVTGKNFGCSVPVVRTY